MTKNLFICTESYNKSVAFLKLLLFSSTRKIPSSFSFSFVLKLIEKKCIEINSDHNWYKNYYFEIMRYLSQLYYSQTWSR